MALIFLHRFILLALAGFWLTLFSSCTGEKTSFSPSIPDTLEDEQSIEGRYQALLRPMNTALAGNTHGKLSLQVMAERLSVTIHLNDGPAQVVHPQYIYSGATCPGENADLNRDGYMDLLESDSFFGARLIPLDGDLASGAAGMDGFPTSDSLGQTHYYREGNLTALLEDLSSYHGPELSLRLAGRVVVIHGVHPDTYLPGTIRAPADAGEHESLPIACGVLERVKLDETQTTDEAGQGDESFLREV